MRKVDKMKYDTTSVKEKARPQNRPPMSNDSGIVIITSVRWISEYAARNSVSIVIIGKREQNGVLEFV